MKKKLILLSLVVFTMVSLIAGMTYIKAETGPVTITTEDGMPVDVVSTKKSNVQNTEDYILENIDRQYSGNEKLDPKDIMRVTNTLVERNKMPAEMTIDALWDEEGNAFITSNASYALMYNADDNSDYYVAFVNTMMNDAEVTDYAFAYMNTNGEVIEDAIYDKETGLAYIPKKYTEENKNELGVLNVQVQLLQVCDTAEPTTKINVKINADDTISGKLAQTGYIETSALDVTIGIPLALNPKAISNVTADKIIVVLNGTETHDYTYNEAEGVLIINEYATSVDTLEISISENNIPVNEEYKAELAKIEAEEQENENSGIETVSNSSEGAVIQNYENIDNGVYLGKKDLNAQNGIATVALSPDLSSLQQAATWTLSQMASPGAVINIRDDNIRTTYYSDRRDIVGSTYTHGVTNADAIDLYKRIANGGDIDWSGEDVRKATVFVQFQVDIKNLTVTDDKGVQYTIPSGTYNLICTHVKKGEAINTWGSAHDNRLRIRVFNVSEDNSTMLVGMATGFRYNQSGAGLFLIKVDVPLTGTIKIEKVDDKGNRRQGVGFHVEGSDINGESHSWDVTTGSDGTAVISGVTYGNYTVKETYAPEGLVKSDEIKQVTVTRENPYITVTYLDDTNVVDFSILKYMEGTSVSDPELLAGVKFKLTNDSDPNKVYESSVSGSDGICKFEKIPAGTYTCEEVLCPSQAMLAEPFTVTLTANPDNPQYGTDGELIGEGQQISVVDKGKSITIEIHKSYADKFEGITDAVLSGAYFTVYTDAAATSPLIDDDGNEVVIGPTDSDGNCTSGSLPTGDYWLKETTFPRGMDKYAEILGEGITYADKIYSVNGGDAGDQQGADASVGVEMENRPYLGYVKVVKYDDIVDGSEESSAYGAKLRLTLKSNPSVYYDAEVNEDGRLEFRNEDLTEYSNTYTIPYGEYEITELNSNEETKRWFLIPETVNVDQREAEITKIISDDEVDTYIRIVKKDTDSRQEVAIAGGIYKIWDCQENKFIVQEEPFTGHPMDEFVTDENGYLVLPEVVPPGDYIIYEIKAPRGYYLDDELRLPENEEDYGQVNGVRVKINKVTDGFPEEAIMQDPPTYTVEVYNTPLKAKLEVYKTGEKLTDASTRWDEKYGDIYVPIYQTKYLEGVTFNVYAAEDIKSPDGRYTYVPANTLVDTITTDESGFATTKDLYLGKYRVEEVEYPIGYLPEEESVEVVLENDNSYLKVEKKAITLDNIRRKFELNFYKDFEEPKYIYSGLDNLSAVFGLYAREAIKNYEGDEVIPADGLVDIIVVKEGEIAKSTADIPEGKYYYKELEISSPRYKMEDTEYDFTAAHDNTKLPTTILVGPRVLNELIKSDLLLFKVSVSTFMKSKETGLRGTVVDMENILEQIQEIEQSLLDEEEEAAKEALFKLKVKLLEGAEYTVYKDEECTDPLRRYGTGEIVKITTDFTGFDTIDDLLMGTYYIKETVPPVAKVADEEVDYDEIEEPVRVDLTLAMDGQSVYRGLVDTITSSILINKTDIFTGDEVPDCEFEIRDLEDEVIIHSITDEEGNAYIPLDLLEQGKEYIYQELDAPDVYKEDGKLYELNTEEHHFTADYEVDEETGEVTFKEVQEVENYRPTRQVLVRKVDEETGEPLQGCKFSIVLLDDNGNPYVNHNGDTVYLVENAVTDENGEYLIENAPKGKYQFIEVEAPEGYDLEAQDMEGYVFEITDDSEDVIIFEVTNTGDIAVLAIAMMAIVSVAGIVFVAKRKLVR